MFLLLVFTVSVFNCATNQSKASVKNRVNHVVLCWLKEPGNASHRQKIIETSKTFQKIPGVLEVRVGESIPSERAIVEDGFDVCIFMSFANTNDMTRYINHSQHKKTAEEVLGPLVQRIVVYDFAE